MSVLSVSAFGRGIVLEGSADAQRTDELTDCDGFDIGPRGQLAASSDVSSYRNGINDDGVATPMSHIYGMLALGVPQGPRLVVAGDGGGAFQLNAIDVPSGAQFPMHVTGITPIAAGVNVTFATFPYTDSSGHQRNAVIVNFGARGLQQPRATGVGGLHVMRYTPPGSIDFRPMSQYDALGTGFAGEFPTGTMAVQLYPRVIADYNDHLFLFGFDNHDATNGDGPTRVMFSNAGNPLKFGVDPLAEDVALDPSLEADRTFQDSDGFTVGGAGEAIRGAYVWSGRLWVGTNKQLHYIEGFGRESFLTNKSVPIRKSLNITGPNAMIEGPNALLYGVSGRGLWEFDGGAVDPIGNRLRDFKMKSLGYWDLIWTDASRGTAFPGQTNQDLVWMLSDHVRQQVWVVIPYCNATAGYGFGGDTVVIKYNVLTGGFSRQVHAGKILTAGTIFPQDTTVADQLFVGGLGGATGVMRYGYQATAATSPVMASPLPVVTFGEYAPFGPNGVGVMRKRYVTIAWEAGALPLQFSIAPTIDGQSMPIVRLTIGATAPDPPADGDLWVDTSGTDTNLGNGTPGTVFGANAADYIPKVYVVNWGGWRNLPGGGEQGTRVTIPIAFDPRRGSRLKCGFICTAASGRFQIEGFAERPDAVRADK